MEIMEIFRNTLKESLQITLFVLSMMLIIEYLTVKSQNAVINRLSKNIWWQVIFSAFLGILPGCLGTFIVVSLYVHGIVNFSSLVAVMIATSGDEAFVMFSKIPQTAIKLNIIIFIVAILSGFILNLIFKEKTFAKNNNEHQWYHPNNIECVCFNKTLFFKQLVNITFERFLLILFSFLFSMAIIMGELGPHKWNYIRIILLTIGLFLLFISITVPDHFISHHLWEHTIKKHLIRIFLWTFTTLLIINILLPYLGIKQENFQSLAQHYYWAILLIAVLIGIIPESGPHFVFIFLFANGYIPFSILLANSIVQDGHGSLPLIAESGKSFIMVKILNILIGLLVAGLMHIFWNI